MENSWDADYHVDNFIYRITAVSEVHSQLSTDETFLKRYIAESTANPELVAVDVADASNSEAHHLEPNAFKWDAKATRYFINAYMERKDKFRDPKLRKKTLWSEMVRDMSMAGYSVDEEILDRKLRNMKKTYKTIKDNNSKKSTGRGRITWEYFDAFEEIFSSDRTVNCGPVVSSMATSGIDAQLDSTALSSSTCCITTSPIPLDKDDPPYKKKRTDTAKNMSSLHYMRKKMVEAEVRKAAATEDLSKVLRETNKILQERNELLRRFVDTRSVKN